LACFAFSNAKQEDKNFGNACFNQNLKINDYNYIKIIFKNFLLINII